VRVVICDELPGSAATHVSSHRQHRQGAAQPTHPANISLDNFERLDVFRSAVRMKRPRRKHRTSTNHLGAVLVTLALVA